MNVEPISRATPRRLLTKKDAADRLGVCVKTIEGHIRRGTLRKIVLSPRCVRVCPDSLEALATGAVEVST